MKTGEQLSLILGNKGDIDNFIREQGKIYLGPQNLHGLPLA
jgi:hypothetical protein